MKTSLHHIAEIIGERTLHMTDAHKLAEIAAYLLDEGRANDLDSLMRDVIAYRAEHGITEATAVSAHELTDQIRRETKEILHREYPKTKTVILRERIDPEVVGGLRIDMADEQLDLSVQAKLNKFKRLTTQERS